MTEKPQLLQLGGVRLGFRNFEGRENQYNKLGDRNFVIFLDPDLAADLAGKGWNVKIPVKPDGPSEDDDFEREAYLQVSFRSDKFPPRIVLVSGEGEQQKITDINPEDSGFLDTSDIANADVVIRPYYYEVGKKSGIKAYLQSLYVTLSVDKFAEKYGFGH